MQIAGTLHDSWPRFIIKLFDDFSSPKAKMESSSAEVLENVKSLKKMMERIEGDGLRFLKTQSQIQKVLTEANENDKKMSRDIEITKLCIQTMEQVQHDLKDLSLDLTKSGGATSGKIDLLSRDIDDLTKRTKIMEHDCVRIMKTQSDMEKS